MASSNTIEGGMEENKDSQESKEVAQGLVQANAGQIMEDVAEENIYELISQGMLQVKDNRPCRGTRLQLPSPF
ncbi:unnamed protein product [Prunus armeniaca]|uniref:Uncharacterized protein n=1 Tax=Prunus armeniaca TaxID=36596 RepID=A0A6J5XB08_PRUAR|nr:unnamed protein product [Prunus armeniaca]CAB4311126.1 unnamed protein product [Prunus armeniaca]